MQARYTRTEGEGLCGRCQDDTFASEMEVPQTMSPLSVRKKFVFMESQKPRVPQGSSLYPQYNGATNLPLLKTENKTWFWASEGPLSFSSVGNMQSDFYINCNANSADAGPGVLWKRYDGSFFSQKSSNYYVATQQSFKLCISVCVWGEGG